MVNPGDTLRQQVEALQNIFLKATKLPISLKTNGRGETIPGTKLHFAAR
jgi:hypothetical protein